MLTQTSDDHGRGQWLALLPDLKLDDAGMRQPKDDPAAARHLAMPDVEHRGTLPERQVVVGVRLWDTGT